jgi:hypothetical protein
MWSNYIAAAVRRSVVFLLCGLCMNIAGFCLVVYNNIQPQVYPVILLGSIWHIFCGRVLLTKVYSDENSLKYRHVRVHVPHRVYDKFIARGGA